jgi:regulator-associated protein of mTOR
MKDRQKTVSAAIVMCLNIGVDPPDVIKTHPCAKTEAWIDPLSFNDTKKSIEAIGKNLQSQYETLSLKTRYKQSLDPCVEDVKRFCNSLRRNARDERILFHYNGHGVPQPTQSGEIWVFNRGYTQYIPISLYDLQTWLGAPCIYVYDCNGAGNIVNNFKKFVQKRIDDDNDGNHDTLAPSPTSAYIDCIQLAACKSNELLPMDPDLPADLFTCCLTCPIDISIKWFIMQSPIKKSYYTPLLELAKNSPNGNIVIPGKLTDRRTPLGELNWIFTAITDTIAWTSLPRPLFKRLFRQDLMVAALFRNFLLAKRIMPTYGCHPISDPPLPDIQFHNMWESWDLAIDQVLTQMLKNLNNEPSTIVSLLPLSQPPLLQPQPQHQQPQQQPQLNGSSDSHIATTNGTSQITSAAQENGNNEISTASTAADINIQNYQHSTFFEQHLTAFELWLKYASNSRQPPEQLPIVLQVLLSQVHRVRALVLLSRFLDLGPWAVYLALSIGIFPYVLKLLQSPSPDLKPVLVFIWARIMAVDYKNTQQELVKDKGFNYFLQMLNPKDNSDLSNNDHKALCTLILSLFVRGFKNGQRLCFTPGLVDKLLLYVETSENPLLRQWCVILISQLWDHNLEIKFVCYKEGFLDRLLKQVNDPIPEVRTSVVLALTNFLPEPDSEEEDLKQETNLTLPIISLANDASPLVRKEVIIFFSKIVKKRINNFVVLAFNELYYELSNVIELNIDNRQNVGYGSLYHLIWKTLLLLSCDGHPQVKVYATKVVDYVLLALKDSPLQETVIEMENFLLQSSNNNSNYNGTNFIGNQQHQTYSNNGQQKLTTLPKPVKVNGTANGGDTISRRSVTSNGTTKNDESIRSVSSGFSLLRRTISLSNMLFNWTKEDNSSHEDNNLNNRHNQSFQSKPNDVVTTAKTARFDTDEASEEYPELPLISRFFDYSVEYFQEPQMRKNEIDEPGSLEYTQKIWRRNRNEATITETQPQKNLSLRGDWKTNIATLNNKTQPKILKFAQFEKYLITSDDRDNITTFNWEEKKQLSKFSNANKFGTKITDLKLLNEDDLPLLLTGTSDGIVKIYKDFQSVEDSRLVTSWRALTDLLLTPRSTGLITEWQQSRGSLLATGDVKIIRIWDAPRELCVVDIPARSSSSITSLTSDQVAGNVFVGGFGDGTVRVYDRRLDPRDSMVKLWKNPNNERSWIQNLHMQRGGYRELVSGSTNSVVNLWDIRLDEPVVTFKSDEKTTTTSIQTHEHAPIIATGSKMIKIWTSSGDLLTSFKNASAFTTGLPNRTPFISSLAFHPHSMMMATNNTHDPYISIYKCTENFQNDYS